MEDKIDESLANSNVDNDKRELQYALGNYLITAKLQIKHTKIIVTNITINRISFIYGEKPFSEIFDMDTLLKSILNSLEENEKRGKKIRLSTLAKEALTNYEG